MRHIHQVEQHRSAVALVEARTLTSNRCFPRHFQDQFGISVLVPERQMETSVVLTDQPRA